MREQARVQRQFSAAAPRYDSKTAMQRQIIDAQLAEVVGTPTSVVDLGCGTGYAISQLDCVGVERLYGVDLAPGMLALARQRTPRATYICANVEALPLASASAELVLSASALQWCDLARVLAEASRVVCVGGQIIVSTFSCGTLADWRKMWGFADSQRFLSASQLRHEVVRAGLHVTQVLTQSYHQRFTDFGAAVDSIREIGAGEPATHGLGGRARYKSAFEQAQVIIAQHGAINLEYCVTTICAIKLGGSVQSSHASSVLGLEPQKTHVG